MRVGAGGEEDDGKAGETRGTTGAVVDALGRLFGEAGIGCGGEPSMFVVWLRKRGGAGGEGVEIGVGIGVYLGEKEV